MQTKTSDIDNTRKQKQDRRIELRKKIQHLEELETESQCADCLILGSCPFHENIK
jgi:hypothetical protein|tara:strand:+ start:1317 stop:1481 length:165 start_codon:yes stop_codon:yes gene_type:complete